MAMPFLSVSAFGLVLLICPQELQAACTDTIAKLQFDVPAECSSTDTVVVPFDDPFGVAQKMVFCDLPANPFSSFALALGPSSNLASMPNPLVASFEIYNHDDWILDCKNSLNNGEVCMSADVEPILSLTNVSVAIREFGPERVLHLVFDFEDEFVVVNSLNTTDLLFKLLWSMVLAREQQCSGDCADLEITRCESPDAGSTGFKIFPSEENKGNISYAFELAESCSQTMDNSLTSLDAGQKCGLRELSPSDVSPEQLKYAGDVVHIPLDSTSPIIQYFAVDESTQIDSITLWFYGLTLDAKDACRWHFSVTLYSSTGMQIATASVLDYQMAHPLDSVNMEFITVDGEAPIVDGGYFKFGVTAESLSGGCAASDMAVMACYDQSSMATLKWFDPIDSECLDRYDGHKNVDVAFAFNLNPSSCSQTMDSTLTSLDIYEQCSLRALSPTEISPGESKYAGNVVDIPLDSNKEIIQYFAVDGGNAIDGITLWFYGITLDAHDSCLWTISVTVYDSSHDIIATGNATDYGMGEFLEGVTLDFASLLPVSLDVEYFKFGVTAECSSGGCAANDMAVMACYDQSNMATLNMLNKECLDNYGGRQNVDVAFLLRKTTIPTDPEPATTATATLTGVTEEGDSFEISSASSSDALNEARALLITVCVLVVIGFFLLFAGLLFACITKADNFVFMSVLVFIVHSIDVFSDLFFCISIWSDNVMVTARLEPDPWSSSDFITYLVLAICSLIFLVCPMVKNFYDLLKFQKITQNDVLHGDRYRAWLESYGTMLYILALVSGSTFGAMKLMNSNLLGLKVFAMGLCLSQLRDYYTYRMVNVVLLENLPQLIIQIAFTAATQSGISTISLVAAISSVVSIVVAVVDHFSKKELNKQQVPSALFMFKVTSSNISRRPHRFKNKQHSICKNVAKVLFLDASAIEVVAIDEYSDASCDGLMVYVLVTTLKYTADDIHQKLKAAVDNGVMDRQMAKAWNLGLDQPHVSALQWLKTQPASPSADQQEGAQTSQTTGTGSDVDAKQTADAAAAPASRSGSLHRYKSTDDLDSVQMVATSIHRSISVVSGDAPQERTDKDEDDEKIDVELFNTIR